MRVKRSWSFRRNPYFYHFLFPYFPFAVYCIQHYSPKMAGRPLRPFQAEEQPFLHHNLRPGYRPWNHVLVIACSSKKILLLCVTKHPFVSFKRIGGLRCWCCSAGICCAETRKGHASRAGLATLPRAWRKREPASILLQDGRTWLLGLHRVGIYEHNFWTSGTRFFFAFRALKIVGQISNGMLKVLVQFHVPGLQPHDLKLLIRAAWSMLRIRAVNSQALRLLGIIVLSERKSRRLTWEYSRNTLLVGIESAWLSRFKYYDFGSCRWCCRWPWTTQGPKRAMLCLWCCRSVLPQWIAELACATSHSISEKLSTYGCLDPSWRR